MKFITLFLILFSFNSLALSWFEAVAKGDTKTVKALIRYGQNINARNESKETALHIASANGLKDVIEILNNSGADVNIENRYGWTALHFASYKGYKPIVETLLEAGANPNIKSSGYKSTPLQLAVLKKHAPLVRILLQAGASKKPKNGYEDTALKIAQSQLKSAILRRDQSSVQNIKKIIKLLEKDTCEKSFKKLD